MSCFHPGPESFRKPIFLVLLIRLMEVVGDTDGRDGVETSTQSHIRDKLLTDCLFRKL
jgi:hypothetical protein